jgi:hypothetical protein
MARRVWPLELGLWLWLMLLSSETGPDTLKDTAMAVRISHTPVKIIRHTSAPRMVPDYNEEADGIINSSNRH